MSFPSPSLPVPSLVPYQFSFRGLAFGGFADDAAYQFIKAPKGVAEPAAVVGGDVQRALDQGELIGVDLLAGRDIEMETLVKEVEGTTLDEARQALSGVLAVGGVTEEPLYLELPSGTFGCMARPRKHACVVDLNAVQAGGAVAVSLLHATDPRWYAVPTKTATTGLPDASGGMTFPAVFPIVFGGGSGAGVLDVFNNGTIEMRPVLVITGPCVNPSVSNLSIAGEPVLSFDITLEEGDKLEIDTDFNTVLYTPDGTTVSADRRNSLVDGSVWWNMQPGLNVISWHAIEGGEAAALTVQSADAFAGL